MSLFKLHLFRVWSLTLVNNLTQLSREQVDAIYKRFPNLTQTQCNLISQRSLGIPSEYLVVTCQHSYEVFHKDRYI